MVLSRAAFGVNGQKVPGIVSWLTSIGWETFLSIMAVLATNTVLRQLGADPGTAVTIIATVIVAALIVGASVLGYHTIMRLQSVLTWLTGAVTIVYAVLAIPHIDLDAVRAIPAGPASAVVGALVMAMTGFGLGWINIAADWSRYQRRYTSDGAIIFWNTFGGSIATVVLIIFGLLLAGSDESLANAIAEDPIGALAVILPTWVLIPFLITAVLALVSGAVLGIYSSGLTLITLDINIPRPAAAAIDGVILTAGTSWAGILIADIFSRSQDYDAAALYDPQGRYGGVDVASISILAIASLLGWGASCQHVRRGGGVE